MVCRAFEREKMNWITKENSVSLAVSCHWMDGIQFPVNIHFIMLFFPSSFSFHSCSQQNETKRNANKNNATDIDECSGDPCEHSGTCIDLVGGFRCECPPEWTGDVCDIGEYLFPPPPRDNVQAHLITIHQMWSIRTVLNSKWRRKQRKKDPKSSNRTGKSHACE